MPFLFFCRAIQPEITYKDNTTMSSNTTNLAGGVRLITETEAASMLGMSKSWLRKRRGLSLRPTATRCGRAIRYSIQEIEQYTAANTARKAAA